MFRVDGDRIEIEKSPDIQNHRSNLIGAYHDEKILLAGRAIALIEL